MAEEIKNKILIVEDEKDIRLLYAEVLTDAGYLVEQASDGEVGYDLIKSTEWDLLLLDVMLPGKDGMNILKDVKNELVHKKGPIILLTNLNSEEIIKDAFGLGADGYLIKSEITPDKIVAEVNHYLGNE
jgi:two-component system response regulator ResD